MSMKVCCGADKCVLVKCVRVETAKGNEGNKGEVTNTTRMTIYCQKLQTCV